MNIQVEIVVAHMTTLVEQVGMKRAFQSVEKRMIEVALELSDNNGQAASKKLKINRTTLVEMRRRHKLPLRGSS